MQLSEMTTSWARLTVLFVGLAAACAPRPVNGPTSVENPATRPAALTYLVQTTPLRASGTDADDLLASVASRLTGVNNSPGTRLRVDGASVPLISAAPVGLAFLSAGPARALIRGTPASSCPALAAAGGADAAAAARAALSACRAALTGRPECGCELVALGDLLLAPPETFAYAPGLPARLIRAGRLQPVTLVAEEKALAGGVTATVLYAGSIPVWRILADGPERASVVPLAPDGTASGPAVAAQRRLLGLDRGRFRERIETAEAGAPLVFLIGDLAPPVRRAGRR